jgi:hypothetical protein
MREEGCVLWTRCLGPAVEDAEAAGLARFRVGEILEGNFGEAELFEVR